MSGKKKIDAIALQISKSNAQLDQSWESAKQDPDKYRKLVRKIVNENHRDFSKDELETIAIALSLVWSEASSRNTAIKLEEAYGRVE